MVSTFMPNVQLEEPARGDDIWDTPMNNNTGAIDLNRLRRHNPATKISP
jgi:hypothetical protein